MQMRKIFTTWFTFEIFVYFVNNFSMSSHTQTEHRFNKIPVCKKSERINVRKTWIFILVKKISMRFTFVVLAHKWEKDFQRYSHFKSLCPSWTFLICFLRSEWFWYVMYVTRYFEGKNLTKHNISNWEKLYWEKSQTGIIIVGKIPERINLVGKISSTIDSLPVNFQCPGPLFLNSTSHRNKSLYRDSVQCMYWKVNWTVKKFTFFSQTLQAILRQLTKCLITKAKCP